MTSVVLRVDGPPEGGPDCPVAAELIALLDATGATTVRCDLAGCTRADLAAVDALARLQLVARRRDCELVVVNVPPALRRLLTAVGLRELLD